MDLQDIYWIPALISGLISAGLALFLWSRRHLPGATLLMAVMLAISWWCLTYACEYASLTFETKFFWSRAEWLGVALVPGLWILFALNYVGSGAGKPAWRILPLFIIPALVIISIWLPPLNFLLWTDVWMSYEGPFPLLVYRRGLLFWIFWFWAYGCLFWGAVLIIRNYIVTKGIYRRQTAVIFVGLVIPWLVNALYVFNLTPLQYLDLSPMAMTLTGLVLSYGLFRFQLLSLTPVASRAVLESMPEGVFIFNQDDRLIGLNAAAEDILGLGDEQVLGHTAKRLFSKRADLKEIRRGLLTRAPEIIIARRDAAVYLELENQPLIDKRGGKMGSLILIRDISSRKKTEIELERTRKLYQVLAENVADLVAMCDSNARYIYASPSFETVLGYKEEELLGRAITDLVYYEDRPLVWKIIDEKRKTKDDGPVVAEFRLVDKSGRVIWFETKGRIVYNDPGKGVAGTFITRDIDARKKAEEALRESQERFALLQEASFGGDWHSRGWTYSGRQRIPDPVDRL